MYGRPVLRALGHMLVARLRMVGNGLHPAILGHQVERRAQSTPDRVACVFERADGPPASITCRELRDRSQAMAAALLEKGLRRGDRFALFAPNDPEVLYALIAASLTGTVAVPIDPRNRGDLFTYIVDHSESKLLLAAADLAGEVRALRPRMQGVRDVLVFGAAGDSRFADFEPLEPLMAKSGEVDRKDWNRDMMAPFQVIYTSGTTGNPKGVVQPNARFFFMSMLGFFFGYRPTDVLYTGLSLSHGNAQGVTVYPALELGIPAVISRRFTKRRIWDIARTHGVTSFSLLGGMASGIHNEPRRDDDARNPVRMVVSAGFPMALWHDFEKRFNLRILEWYASVEGGFTCRPIGQGPHGTFGKARVPGIIEFRIVDEEDRDVPPGSAGEIISRMKVGQTQVEYLRNPSASKDKTRGGWLRSGDMGHMDAEGWMFFDYRKGRSLRRQGDFVPTDQVEKVIGDLDEITEVYVYGVPAASGAPGEVDLVAAVAPHDGAKIDHARIAERCRAALPRNFVPSYIQVLPEIPKTPSEKPKDEFLRSSFDPKAANVYTLC
ncbi:MAG: AMP-binding protein [Nitrospirae bacterium]|nr:AMP-binding protein [Nitrospirota bacterium]